MPRLRRIALDLGSMHFLESTRANAYRGVLRYAQTRGRWQLLLNDHHFSLLGKYRELSDLARLGAEGIILSYANAEKLATIRRLGLKAITVASDLTAEGIPSVFSDDAQAGRLAAGHFLERGFRSFGFIGSKEVPWDLTRWRGFASALEAQGQEPAHFESRHSADPALGRRKAARLAKWLRSAAKPFAVYCSDDTHAFQVLDCARRAGLAVPQEVAILGTDNNLLICGSTTPTLSSVEPDAVQVGYRAAQLLDEILAGADPPAAPILVPPRGIETRQSTDVLAIADPVVSRALHFIGEHLAEAHGATEIGLALGVSRRTVESRFREHLGRSVNETVRARRLDRARGLLLDPLLSIQEIAALCGFQSAAYFCTSFRRATGLSPTEWRARERPGD